MLNTRFRILSVGILSLWLHSAAFAAVRPDQLRCVFSGNSLAFGASVTQATPAVIPGYALAVKTLESSANYLEGGAPETNGIRPEGPQIYGLSPIRYVVKALAGKKSLRDISYVGAYLTRSRQDFGVSQIGDFLQGQNRPLFDKSSFIMGIDAFYWDALHDACFNTGTQIQSLIQAAKVGGKVVVLGTVPHEDPAFIRINSKRPHIPNGMWDPNAETPDCIDRVNNQLKQFCTVENNCYLVDLDASVARLRQGEKFLVFGQGPFGYYDLRPDGVHLSPQGSRWIAETVIHLLMKNPPRCAQDS